MIVTEVVDLVKRRKCECLIFKVDFEKAMIWGFVGGITKDCVFGGNMSILVNGSPLEEII